MSGKKMISVILSVCMIWTAVFAGCGTAAFAADKDEATLSDIESTVITRINWLHELVSIFNLYVEEDNYPDNYFSDLSTEDEFYRDVMLACEFGMIDIEAGEALKPQEAVTRDFAAQTFNALAGFVNENKNYSFSDMTDIAHPDAAQVAINRGWLELRGGVSALIPMNQLPKQNMIK